mmetsp:Transcript_1832/g.3727  ORF Transcript_1832/g.3727 Transcript_1832/m.3727 type:complete len:422 (-) Transcript_1832:229-1494(-)
MNQGGAPVALPEIPKCPNCNVSYSEDRPPQRFACREHDCCKVCTDHMHSRGIKQCPQCRVDIGVPTPDRWLLRLAVFVRKAREAQRKRLMAGKPLTVEAKNAMEQAFGYLHMLFGENGVAANGKIPDAEHFPDVPIVEEVECVMCAEVFSDLHRPLRLECNHCVCEACIGEWAKDCPKCRAPCANQHTVDESLLEMAKYYDDLCQTVRDAKTKDGENNVNRDTLDVLNMLYTYTKHVLSPPKPLVQNFEASSSHQDGEMDRGVEAPSAPPLGAADAAGASDDDEAEEDFKRQLRLAIEASKEEHRLRARRDEEEEEEAAFRRQLQQAIEASQEQRRMEIEARRLNHDAQVSFNPHISELQHHRVGQEVVEIVDLDDAPLSHVSRDSPPTRPPPPLPPLSACRRRPRKRDKIIRFLTGGSCW